MARNVVRKMPVSMRGVTIDMDAMRAANEMSVAVGQGTRMNARGDIMGMNGQIEVRREQIAREYLAKNPQGAQQVSLKPAFPDEFETPEQAMARMKSVTSAETDAPSGLAKRPRKLLDKDED